MTQDDERDRSDEREERAVGESDEQHSESERLERKIAEQPDVSPARWVKRAVWLIVLAILGYVAWRIAAAYFPRWWAQQIGDLVQGRVSYGTMWGLFVGFTFTLVPLLVLFEVRRRFWNWWWRGVVAVFAVILALPNLLTLGVVIGNREAAYQAGTVSSANQAADRIFDVEGVGFRNASLVGAIAGALIAFTILFISLRLAGRKKRIKKLEGERDELRRARDEHGDENGDQKADDDR